MLFSCLYSDKCSNEMINLTYNIPVYLSSPNYDLGLRYPNDIDCQWFFTDSVIGTFIVSIIDMYTEYWDRLSIGFGTNVVEESKVAEIRESQFPETILLPHREMWIRFASNKAIRFRGFLLEVKRVPEIGRSYPDQIVTMSTYDNNTDTRQ